MEESRHGAVHVMMMHAPTTVQTDLCGCPCVPYQTILQMFLGSGTGGGPTCGPLRLTAGVCQAGEVLGTAHAMPFAWCYNTTRLPVLAEPEAGALMTPACNAAGSKVASRTPGRDAKKCMCLWHNIARTVDVGVTITSCPPSPKWVHGCSLFA